MKRKIGLLLIFLVLFIVATAIRYTALLWYPEYVGPAHLASSILAGLASVPVVLLVLSSQFFIKVAANASPSAVRLYGTTVTVLAAVGGFLMTYYGHPLP
ncbi:hypothetical protein [Methanoculleus sp. 7T]|uniref:hypothetical protein n=1 Tax=Methanoculleus sp. 7T TaxID=2937282 RepID=UPI0020C1127D|nr:hypothetical protein [Methanoculleus sp. 7T]MCK8518420.1 hypothetical protein [Methanoculleus sp. 7T]